jgi:cell wall-associated NlpC family hydrolase
MPGGTHALRIAVGTLPLMTSFDPRITPARPDLAASRLRGKVQAARFADGAVQEVVVSQTAVRDAPSHGAAQVTEALLGERVTIYETDEEGWAWGQLEADGYVGWLASAALLAPGPAPTHRVAVPRTLMFPGPSIKLPPSGTPPLGATLAIARTEGPFAITALGSHVPARHLAPVGTREPDFVAIAERFLDAPYLWGGKTNHGIDCSGLVQVSLTACGIACPRDSDMQQAALGQPVEPNELRRGDLLFWKGHVAIARDSTTIIHANAHHMMVAVEPVTEALARIRASGSELTGVRRL